MPEIGVEPWGPGDIGLLHALLGDPAMMVHLGGPEAAERIAKRQADYEQPGSRQYRIVVDGAAAGWVGYWECEWREQEVLETGRSVLPGFQGRGVAGAGTASAIAAAGVEGGRRFLQAHPSVDNAPSNGTCRKIGVELNR
ncbi:MAG: GNAT family N-acetyltransferase [Gaiellaceae bacterium]